MKIALMTKKMKTASIRNNIIVARKSMSRIWMSKNWKKPGDLNRNKWSQKRGKIMKSWYSKILPWTQSTTKKRIRTTRVDTSPRTVDQMVKAQGSIRPCTHTRSPINMAAMQQSVWVTINIKLGTLRKTSPAYRVSHSLKYSPSNGMDQWSNRLLFLKISCRGNQILWVDTTKMSSVWFHLVCRTTKVRFKINWEARLGFRRIMWINKAASPSNTTKNLKFWSYRAIPNRKLFICRMQLPK